MICRNWDDLTINLVFITSIRIILITKILSFNEICLKWLTFLNIETISHASVKSLIENQFLFNVFFNILTSVKVSTMYRKLFTLYNYHLNLNKNIFSEFFVSPTMSFKSILKKVLLKTNYWNHWCHSILIKVFWWNIITMFTVSKNSYIFQEVWWFNVKSTDKIISKS